MSIQIIKPGSSIIIDEDIHGKVIQVLIKANDYVQYKCVWWDKKTRKDEWLESSEIEYAEEQNRQNVYQIGFIKGKKRNE